MTNKQGIETEKLHIGYRSDLIADITFSVKPGQIVSLIGPNGCGKTTLLKTLTGALSERGGVVFLEGTDRTKLKASQVAKCLSVVMTYRVKPELMTCAQVVEIGRYPYTGRLGILSEEDRRIVREAMEWTDVSDLANELFQNLSDGQRQRVLLARAICQEPSILILDEPTSYLDIAHKLTLLQKIRDYAREKQVAILMSLHELEIARNISDTVVALGEGAVMRIGSPGEVFREDFIRKLYHIEGMDTDLLGVMPWKKEGGESLQAGGEQEDAEGSAPAGNGNTAETENAAESENAAETEKAVKTENTAENGKDRSAGKAKTIMIQGTMSNAGKSLIAAGLCRIFSDDGYRVAPFKSQNMALNSYITKEGLEMGRAQVVQAECARCEPLSIMNPILLKPTTDLSSQVIVNGKAVGNKSASEYFKSKRDYIPDIRSAFDQLAERFDIIVIEGAGSPVEMNLKEDDIVNMGLASLVDAPVLLVGDIDRGGVFAQLLGTLELLEKEERDRVAGLIVNKFRGDKSLFEDGVRILEERGKKKVVGVVPFLDVELDAEDSLAGDFAGEEGTGLDIAILRLPHISQFTDFEPLRRCRGVSARYVTKASQLGDPDLILLPGTKNTLSDLKSLRESGLADALIKKAGEGTCILGICGGYQMLGRRIEDPLGLEGGGSAEGLGLLPVDTMLEEEKTTKNVSRRIVGATGVLKDLAGSQAFGYEIHMGKSTPFEEVCEFTEGGSGCCRGNVYGTYLHGFFDKKEILSGVLEKLAKANKKEIDLSGITDHDAYKESQYDRLAKGLRENLDLDRIYKVMGLKR